MISFSRRDPLSALQAFPPIEDYPESMRGQIAALRVATRRRKIVSSAISAVFYALMTCVLIGIAWLITLATDRGMPTLTSVDITTPVVAPGADLAMDVHPHLLKLCEGKVVFRAYDRAGNIINQSETEWHFPVVQIGPDRTFNRRIRISRDAVASLPDERRPGMLLRDARMRIERKYFCNPVQKLLGWPIVEVTPDMPFSIASPDGRQ